MNEQQKFKRQLKAFIDEVCWNWSIESGPELKEMYDLELKHFGFTTFEDE